MPAGRQTTVGRGRAQRQAPRREVPGLKTSGPWSFHKRSRNTIEPSSCLNRLALRPAAAMLGLWRLRVDAADVDVRRSVEPAAWVWAGVGIASQPAPASGEQNRQTDHGHGDLFHRPSLPGKIFRAVSPPPLQVPSGDLHIPVLGQLAPGNVLISHVWRNTYSRD
jgi:hypothetical protein